MSMKRLTNHSDRSSRVIVLVFLACLLCGCAVGPDYLRPEAPELPAWSASDSPAIRSEAGDVGRWWQVFNDPALDRLIETACQENLDLHIAGLRILESRAKLGIAVGGLYPQQQAVRGGWTHTRLSKHTANTQPGMDMNYGEAGLGFDAAWELDLWGKFRRAVEAGTAMLDASVAQYDDILVTLTAEVTRTYVLMQTLGARLAIARENAQIQKRSLQVTQARFQGGYVSELDVSQAKALLNETLAAVPRLKAGLKQTRNGLAILLGMLPGEVDAMLPSPEFGAIPPVPGEITVSVPAQLLRRRPDIRLAERRLAAQCALIGIAKADLYPSFTLFGTIGLRASDSELTYARYPEKSSLGDIWRSDSVEFLGGPSFSWNIFNYGRIKNNVRVQDARFQQLAIDYRNTVLKATQEVEDAMAAFLMAQETLARLSESLAAAARSVELSMVQYREGLVDFQRVLDTQRFQTQVQDLLTSTQGAVALNLIATYKALGGGWEIRENRDFLPEDIKREMQARTDWGDMLTPAAQKEIHETGKEQQWREPESRSE
jgi:NodT family efflux transporter outer membrane factor (OMF) lipoprotein